jgi:protein-disulfide isomerase
LLGLVLLVAVVAAGTTFVLLRFDRPSVADDAVRTYLLQNPEVVLDALKAYQEREQRQAQAHRRQAIKAHRVELAGDSETPYMGSRNPDVTIVEFFDYTCPYCRQAHPIIGELLRDDPKVRVALKEYPILSERAVLASRFSLAIHRIAPDRYAAFHEALYAVRGALDEATIFRLAGESGVDLEQLGRVAQSDEIGSQLERTARLAQAIGVDGTPAFVIGDEFVPGSVDLATLKRLVRQARERCETC